MEVSSILKAPDKTAVKKQRRKLILKVAGYNAACTKYRAEIEAIQRLMPGWKPELPTF